MKRKSPKSKIIEKSIVNGKEWEIPAKGGVGCLMLFGALFCLPPLFILVLSIFGVVKGTGEQNSIWMLLGAGAFLSLFFMIGGGIMYYGYRSSRTTHAIRVRDGAIEVVKQFSKKESVEKLESGGVQGVGLYVSSKVNNRPVFGLVVKGRDGNDLRMLSGHNQDELRWLASQMLESLAEQGGLPTEREIEEMYFSKDDESDESDEANDENGSGVNGRANFAKQGVKISLLGGDEFEIEKNGNTIAKTLIISGLSGMVFSCVFIGIGFFADDGPIIFGIIGGIFELISLYLFFKGLSKIGTTERFTFKSDSILRENLRGRLSSKKSRFLKSSFSKLEVKSSGSSNNEERYSVTLRGATEKLKMFHWVNQDISQAVKIKVNAWLKSGADSLRSENESDESLSNMFSGGYGSAITLEKTSVISAVREKISPSDVLIYQSTPNLKDIKGGKWYLRLFLGLFIAVGLGLVITGIFNIKSAMDSVNWPAVSGVISKSKVKSSTSDGSTTYGADISYDYLVNGQSFKGDKVTFGDVSTSSRSRADKIVARYPVGKKVVVIYSPDAPADSVLESGLNGGIWLLPGVGSMFFFIPLIILIITERNHRNDTKSGKPEKGKSTLRSGGAIQKKFGKM